MKSTIRLKPILTTLMVSIISIFSFAINVGEEVELTQYMNARYPNADFRRTANNIAGQLATGTRARVMEVKRFKKTGNFGFLVDVLDGNLSTKKVWVYYNPNSPSLKLFDRNGAAATKPIEAQTGVTTRPTPVVVDPVLNPAQAAQPAAPVVVARPPIPVTSPSPTAIPSPVVSPVPDPAVAAIGAINQGNQAVGQTAPCVGCDLARATAAAQPSAPAAPVAAAPAATNAQLDFIVSSDSLITDTSLTAEKRRIHQFLSFRAHISNYSVFCERFFPSSNYMNLATTKWNSLAGLIRQHNTALGGINEADRILTAYMNRASNKFTQINLNQRETCTALQRSFLSFLSLPQADILQYLSLDMNQRRSYINQRSN